MKANTGQNHFPQLLITMYTKYNFFLDDNIIPYSSNNFFKVFFVFDLKKYLVKLIFLKTET